MPSRDREFETSQVRCAVRIEGQFVDPWAVTVAKERSGARQLIEVSLGRLVLQYELEQSGEAPPDLRAFVLRDVTASPEIAMKAYLEIVRGARARTGLVGMIDRWRAKGTRPLWAWMSVDRVEWSE